MRKEQKQAAQEAKTRLAMREEIIMKFGIKAVGAATIRLCANCAVSNCFLLPLTSTGEDCPYYRVKEGEE